MKRNVDGALIGKRIRAAREKAGLTQYDLHDLTGISITQISAYENGKRNIGLRSLEKIADATGTTMDGLCRGKGEDRPITASRNEGELIINCITALFEQKVITSLPHEDENPYVGSGSEIHYRIGFCQYVEILDDYIKKMVDFEKNKNDYSSPNLFKEQLREAAAKKINDAIAYQAENSKH